MANKFLIGSKTHVNPVRVKVSGDGSLQAYLFDSGLINNSTLAPIDMTLTSDASLNYLSNFRGERVSLLLMTTEIDEYFVIKNIAPFVKLTQASNPQ